MSVFRHLHPENRADAARILANSPSAYRFRKGGNGTSCVDKTPTTAAKLPADTVTVHQIMTRCYMLCNDVGGQNFEQISLQVCLSGF
jgi:hypothetical protein